MAIDTAGKRFSMIKFGDMASNGDPIRGGGAAITATDRADWLHLYRGIALDAPPEAEPVVGPSPLSHGIPFMRRVFSRPETKL